MNQTPDNDKLQKISPVKSSYHVRQSYGLAHIPTCRSPSPASLSRVPRDRLASCRTWLYGSPMHIDADRVGDFVMRGFFACGDVGITKAAANPWAKVRRKGRPVTHPGLTSCQISSPCIIPRRRYPLQKCCGQQLQTNKQ